MDSITDIKIFVYTSYGIRLYTGITDVYGHYQPFECIGYSKDTGVRVKLSDSGENPINRDELELLKEVKEYIINTYTKLTYPIFSFN